MFNSLLDRKQRMLVIVFWWALIISSLAAAIGLYKWLLPEKRTDVVTETKYEVVKVVDLGSLSVGAVVRFQGVDMCLSSIETSNLKQPNDLHNPPVTIYLRMPGNCLPGDEG